MVVFIVIIITISPNAKQPTSYLIESARLPRVSAVIQLVLAPVMKARNPCKGLGLSGLLWAFHQIHQNVASGATASL